MRRIRTAGTRRTLAAFALALLPALLVPKAAAFQVLPRISDVDRKLAGVGGHRIVDSIGQWVIVNAVPLIKSPVHEAITLDALDCHAPAGAEASCVTVDEVRLHQILLYGVRWPDDPPFALSRTAPPRIAGCDPDVTLRSTAQPKCWQGMFADAERTAAQRARQQPGQAAFGPGDYLLYRSHFGDLAFFHAMGSYDGEPARDTVAHMRMWAQFLWGVATQRIPVDRYLRTVDANGLGAYFPGDMTATNLFATGIVEVRARLDEVALGVLLHMVQDSFSHAHTERALETGAACAAIPRFAQPGKIARFYSYALQDERLHNREDTFGALAAQTLQTRPNVVDVTSAFLALYREKASWPEAEKYFDCVFALQDPGAPAGPGPYVDTGAPRPGDALPDYEGGS
ncbi:hypothetical protein AKI39_20745 [Bordetella sp. H567]|uniref:hypothetical protein n=1 Tax=Bordetella sp. H567 TaxID=1697043 RepID=UPI00081C9A9C|nr:hypothetical protein [Bordetella sp. H567]AOB32644.1 hypothetical protein AKI39_20745 [Bordetella sp. H567]